jgi:integrase/recombinase XerD
MGILDKLIKKASTASDGGNDEECLFKGGRIADAASSPTLEQPVESQGKSTETNKILEDQETSEPELRGPGQEEPAKLHIKAIPGTVKLVNKKLTDGFGEWLRVERNRGQRTIQEYVRDLRTFAEFLIAIRNASLKSAGVEDIRAFVRHLRGKGCGPAGVNRRLAALKTFYAWAIREGYVKYNPSSSELVDRFKIPKRLPIYLTETEHEDFMRALEPYDAKKRAFIALLNLGGLRISEACALKEAEHLVKEGAIITAIRVVGKGDKERIVPVHPALSRFIEEWLKRRNGVKSVYLFPGKKGHIRRNTGWAWFKEFKVGTGFNGKLTPHKLRHTFATRLYRRGTPVFDLQDLLGHADPRTTRIYAHVNYEALKTHIQKL